MANCNIIIPAPEIINVTNHSFTVKRPGANWPTEVSQLFLEIRTPVGNGNWVNVGSLMQSTGASTLTISTLTFCSQYEARWTTGEQ